MVLPAIRSARPNEDDEVARVWMDSFVSSGVGDGSATLLAQLRARIRREIEKGWSLYVADDDGRIAAMLALHVPNRYLDQLFVAPEYQRAGLGRRLLGFTREKLPEESGCAASARTRTRGAGTSARVLCSRKKRSSR